MIDDLMDQLIDSAIDRLVKCDAYMSARDRFAAAALTGIVAGWSDNPLDMELIATQAYELADAMIKQSAKGDK